MEKQDTKVPAIGFSVVCNIPGDRQLTLQFFVGGEEDDGVLAAAIDKLLRQTDRVRNHYELPDLLEKLALHERTYAQFEEDLKRTEAAYNADKARREVEMQTYEEEAKKVHDKGYAEHVNSGRRGDYTPSAARKQRINAARIAQDQVKAEQVKADAEREKFLSNLEISRTRYQEEITRLKAEIDKRESA